MRRIGLGAAALATMTAAAHAQSAEPDVVRVWGRGLDQIGVAQTASQGVVGYDDFKTRPLARVGELMEVVPGLVATQHSGEGKANQYFLRGFNLDHGTDFSATVDGVPVNLRTHGHGQGYLDLNFLIPEIVERVDYRKGPYFAEGGDFSSAGAVAISTYDRLDESFAELTVGENDYWRGVAGASLEAGGADLLLAGELLGYDGPWRLDQDLEKTNLLARLSGRAGGADYALTLTAYDSAWTSTDQVPLRAIQSGMIGEFGHIDPDLGGQTERYSLAAETAWDHGGGETRLNAYAVAYDFTLFSNFTYFLDDPVNGDEFEQRDDRRVYGGALTHERELGAATLRMGAQARYDDIAEVGLFRTAGRQRLSTVRRDAVEELSLGAFAEAEVALTPDLRAIAGLRADYYDAEVTALSHPVNGGEADDALLSPSASLAWRAAEGLELYASYGRGFHSNDVRGATISVDPVGGAPADPVDILVPSEGAEIGARLERGPLNLAVSAFWLELDSELVFVGDAGGTEVNDASRRFGVEGAAFWEAADGLVFDVSGAWTDAEFSAAPSGADRIPGAVETVLGGGATLVRGPWTASARLRHFGEAPLIEDDSVRSNPTTVVNLGAAYDFGRFTLGVDLLNAFDSDDTDIAYFYESQLAGEAAPVEDLHIHPVEPRQVRVRLRARF